MFHAPLNSFALTKLVRVDTPICWCAALPIRNHMSIRVRLMLEQLVEQPSAAGVGAAECSWSSRVLLVLEQPSAAGAAECGWCWSSRVRLVLEQPSAAGASEGGWCSGSTLSSPVRLMLE